MSQEFYLKAQTLHEEFQKKELYYLNKERIQKSSIMSKREFNLPYQEYLQKINQREKESEETYRNIMKQMEELDRHTDVMSLKLEKLGILRNSLTTFTLPNWPSSAVSSLQTYTENFNSKYPRFESVEHNVKSTFQADLNSVSTQTENAIYCEKCHSLILGQPEPIKENESTSFLSTESRLIVQPQTTYSKSQEDSFDVKEVHGNSLFIKDNEPPVIPANIDKGFIEENSKTEQQKIHEKNIHSNVTLSERHNSVEDQIEPDKNLNSNNMQNGNIKKAEQLPELQEYENENSEAKSPDFEANADTFVSKSDAESMNNEFDFLETDARIESPKMKADSISKSHKLPSSHTDISIDKGTSLMVEHPNQPPLKNTEKNVLNQNVKLKLADDKSDTSGSVSAPQSPNISIASDSDSPYAKGSPVTASAAYQALLGNTVIPTKTKKINSDSESEDEVENALANVVQRSHVKSKSSKSNQVAETKNKSSTQPADPQPTVKGSKLPTSTKPQSKLSKNTRKVLGLDTSSGSEVELTIKPPKKKIEEDSDEFDFFD